tara:strand:- start:19 stop:207 length:189 start_codon:yes stop_codon:yes gene_type:complete
LGATGTFTAGGFTGAGAFGDALVGAEIRTKRPMVFITSYRLGSTDNAADELVSRLFMPEKGL